MQLCYYVHAPLRYARRSSLSSAQRMKKYCQLKKLCQILCLIVIIGCQQHSMYKPSPNKGWHIIDLKAFEVSTPKSYKCIIREGVDFFAGELTDGNIRIFFGYGCHIDPSPRDKIDDIERNSDHINLISYSKYLHKILDVSKYSKEGEVNLTELFNDFQDLKLLAYSDTVKLSTPKPDSMEYYFSFIYDDIIYNIPFDYDQRVIENEKNTSFRETPFKGYILKNTMIELKVIQWYMEFIWLICRNSVTG